jgi:hypothetical protein
LVEPVLLVGTSSGHSVNISGFLERKGLSVLTERETQQCDCTFFSRSLFSFPFLKRNGQKAVDVLMQSHMAAVCSLGVAVA